ncbi:MAG: fused MFS/spermidine synthase [Victivallaceae bacterium]
MRFLLYVIAFISGFAMMSYEILGVRVLAPFYGSSVYVWGAAISVFLAGLSVGYAAGGKIADRRADGKILALLLAVPALLILLFPFYGCAFCNMVFALGLDSRLGALLLSLLLFFIPSGFIGALLPVIAGILAAETGKAGSAAGNACSASTVGSIAGTLFTSFYLISWTGVSKGIVLTGSLLGVNAVICLVYYFKKNAIDSCFLDAKLSGTERTCRNK